MKKFYKVIITAEVVINSDKITDDDITSEIFDLLVSPRGNHEYFQIDAQLEEIEQLTDI